MGKSFKGFSKALSLILAVAMVVTCVPTSAYAAELLADESEDILISNDSLVEESSDALVTDDASASEEKSSSLIDTQKEADLAAAPEENTAGEEEISNDKYLNDLKFLFSGNLIGTGSSLGNTKETNFLKANNGAAGATAVGSLADAFSAEKVTFYPVTNHIDYDETGKTAISGDVFADSDNGISFIVEPAAGCELKGETVTYDENGKEETRTNDGSFIASLNYAEYSSDTAATVKKITTGWTVENFDKKGYNRGSKKVTIPKSVLAPVKSALRTKADGTILGKEIVIVLGDIKTTAPTDYAAAKAANLQLKPAEGVGCTVNDITSDNYLADTSKDFGLEMNTILDDVYNKTALTVNVKLFDENGKQVNYKTVAAGTSKATAFNTDEANFTNAGSTYYDQTPNAETIFISKALLASLFNSYYTPQIVITAAGAAVNKYAITYDTTSSTYVNFYSSVSDAAKSTSVGADASGNDAFSVWVKTKHTGAKVSAVYAKEAGSDTKVQATHASGNEWTFAANVLHKNFTIFAETTESVGLFTGVTHVTVIDNKGLSVAPIADNSTSAPVTNGEYKFIVIPDNGYSVAATGDAVKYVIGENAGVAITPDKNGVYTIAKDIINDSLRIYVDPQALDVTAPTTTVKADADYSGSLSGDADIDVIQPATDISDGNASATVKKGEPVYFTVESTMTSSTDLLDNVYYTLGSSTTKNSLTEIAVTAGGVHYFRIPAATDTVKVGLGITAAAEQLTVTAPLNNKVKFTVNGTKLTTGSIPGTITLTKGEPFTVTVEPVDDTIEVMEVSYGPTPTVLGDTDGDYPISSTIANTATLDFNVKTLEVVPTNKFMVYFAGTATKWDNTYKTKYDTSSALIKDQTTVESQRASLIARAAVYSMSATRFYPVTNGVVGGTAIGPASGEEAVYTFEPASTTGVLDIEDSDPAKVKAVKTGEETILASLLIKEPDASDSHDYNERLYAAVEEEDSMVGKLPVTVTGSYEEGSVKIVATSGSIYPATASKSTADYIAGFHLVGKNTVSGVTENINYATNNDVAYVDWTFDPDTKKDAVPTHYFATGANNNSAISTQAYVATSKNGNAPYQIWEVTNTGVYVAATEVQSDITVKAVINYADGTKSEPYTTTLSVIKEPDTDKNYFLAANVKEKVYNYNFQTAPAIAAMGLGKDDITTFNVSYPVYQVIDDDKFIEVTDQANLDDAKAYATEKQIDKAKAKGYIKDAEGITYGPASVTGIVEDGKNVTNQYLELAGENGTYTLTAKKVTNTAITFHAPAIYVNGVKIDALNHATNRNVDVTKIERNNVGNKVRFILYDEVTDAEGTKTIVEHKLKASYTDLFDTSEIVDEVKGGDTWQKVTGLMLNDVADGSYVRLPGAEDFSTSPATGRVLAGWQYYGTNVTSPVAGNVYRNTNEYVLSSGGNLVCKAIWADRYAITQLSNGNLSEEVDDDYNEGQKIDGYDVAIGDVSKGSQVPVVLRVVEVDGVNQSYTGGTDPALALSGKTQYVKGGFTLTEKDNITKEAISITPGTATTSPVIVGKKTTNGIKNSTVVASWTDPSGAVRTKESAKFEVTAEYELEAEITPATISLEAGMTAGAKTAVTFSLKSVAGSTETAINGFDADNWSVDPMANYQIEWGTADETIATIESQRTIGTGSSSGYKSEHSYEAWISPLKVTAAGETVDVTINIKDANGKTATATAKLKVVAPKYTLSFVDENGAAISTVDALANQSSATTNTSTVLVKTVDEDGKEVTAGGTWTVKTPDSKNKVFDGKICAIGALGGTKYQKVTMLTNNVAATDVLTVQYTETISGITYEASIPVTTFYAIRFQKDTDTFVTVGGTKKVDKDNKPVDVDLKLNEKSTEAVKDTDETVLGFAEVSLATYAAVFEDSHTTNKTTKTFRDWAHTAVHYDEAEIEALTISDFTNGVYTLTATMDEDIALSGIPQIIRLTDDTVGGGNTATISIDVKPWYSTQQIYMAADSIGFYTVESPASSTLTPTNGVYTLANPSGTSAGKTVVVKFTKDTTTPQAGAAVLKFYGSNPDDAFEADLFVNGLDKSDNILRYYEDGELVKSDVRSVGTTKYYFDEKGEQVTGTKIVEIGGKKRLFVSGTVAAAGIQTYNSNKYYIGADGEVLTGWLDATGKAATAANGVYYADPAADGKLAIGLVTIDGKTYAFDNMNKLAKASASANLFEKVGSYYVDKDGNVALKQQITVEGKAYIVDAEGALITQSKAKYNAENGKWEYTLEGTLYYINDDNTVVAAKTYYFTGYEVVEWKWNSGAPTVDVKMNYVADDGDATPTETVKLNATTADPDTVEFKTYTATTTAKYVKKGASEKETVTLTKKYDKDGKSAEYTYKSHKFEWPKELGSATKPDVKATVTYSVKEEGVAKPDETIDTAVSVSDATVEGNYKVFTATLTTIDGLTKSETKKYNTTTGKAGDGISIEGLEEEYKFAGTAIKPAITVVDNDLGITLAEGTDYKISYKDNTKVGTATITVNGKGNYTGKNVTAQFKIVSATEGIEGLATKVNKVEKIAFNPTYTGEPQAPEKVTVIADGESIVYEWNGSEFQKITDTTKDVGLTIVNNVNAGTATVAAVGADGKAKKANFKINKVDLSAVSAEQLAVEVEEEAAYLVKGAKPGVSVTYTPEGGSAIELINGQDFKVEYKYANKKNAGEGNTIKIKGNGANFTKAKEVTDKPFKIVKHALQDEDIVCVDAYTGIKPKKVKVVVKDSAGVVVPAKQYEVHVFTDEGLEITTDKNAKLEAGKEYTIQVKASASGNLEGEASAKVTAQANIGKAKATLSASLKKDGVAYTGEPIDLENYQSGELIINYFESGIKLTLKGVGDLTYGEDFEVAGYVNNVNKGTMTVYVRGISDKCSGTLGIKVKISAKTMKKAE